MKIIKHERDKIGDFQKRVLIHIPIGLLIGIPIIGKPVKDLFIEYENNEDLHTKDQAWKDYYGASVGASIMQVLIIGALIYLIISLA